MYKYIIYACNMKHHLSRHIRNLFSQQSNPTILFLKYSNEPEDCHLSQWLLTQGQINMIKSIYLNSEWRAEINNRPNCSYRQKHFTFRIREFSNSLNSARQTKSRFQTKASGYSGISRSCCVMKDLCLKWHGTVCDCDPQQLSAAPWSGSAPSFTCSRGIILMLAQ